jgi:hypothetical protein
MADHTEAFLQYCIVNKLGGAVVQAKDRFPPPSLLLFQLGSNDLTEIKSVDRVNNITSDILRFKLLFPNALAIYPSIDINYKSVFIVNNLSFNLLILHVLNIHSLCRFEDHIKSYS